jgi:hypothetical protein
LIGIDLSMGGYICRNTYTAAKQTNAGVMRAI